jgi:O-antigen/teichoic acid export membrane protein
MYRAIVRNAISNWLGFAIHVAVAFLLTPFVLTRLGEERYGAWTLIVGLTGHYGLLDLGFRAGLTQYLTRHLAVRDYDRVNEAASTGFVALATCGALVFLGSVGMTWIAPHVFHLPPGSVGEVRWALLINGAAVAAQFALFAHSAILTATQRFDLSSAIGVITRLATAAGTVMCLKAGGGLVSISLVVAGGNLLDYGLRLVAAYRVLPQLAISPSKASRSACWAFLSFGLWNVGIGASTRFISYSDEIVIGLFMTTAAIAPFALAASLVHHFGSMFGPIGMVFFPAATHLDARGEVGALREMYMTATRLMLLLAITAGVISSYLAGDFFRLWIGSKWETGPYHSPALLFQILIAGAVITAAQRVGCQVLLGTRRVKLLSILFGCEALANVGLSMFLAPRMGLLGVALGTLIPAVICQGVVQPIALGRILGFTWTGLVRAVYVRPMASGAILAAALYATRHTLPNGDWPQFFLKTFVAVVMATATVALVGLDNDQRELYLVRPFRRLRLDSETGC